MDAKELLNQIEAHQGELPGARYVPELYAEKLALVASRLTPTELSEFITLGALIRARSSVRIPVYRLHEIPDHILEQGRPVG